MRTLFIIGLYTIWLTPFIFVFNLIGAMKAIKNSEDTDTSAMICGVSLFLILYTIVYPLKT